MKLPREIGGADLVKALRKLGCSPTRQKGSHVRVTTQVGGEHHEVVPMHDPIKPGTLSGILKSVALHHKMSLPDLIVCLDL